MIAPAECGHLWIALRVENADEATCEHCDAALVWDAEALLWVPEPNQLEEE